MPQPLPLFERFAPLLERLPDRDLGDADLAPFELASDGPLKVFYAPFDWLNRPARAAALTLAQDDPRRVTAVMARAGRAGRVFVDWGQNDRNKTTVCAYSVRARERPTVSLPVGWDELEAASRDRRRKPLAFEAGGALERRLAHLGDLLDPALALRQRLPRL